MNPCWIIDNPGPIIVSPGCLYDKAFNVFYEKVLCKVTPSTVELVREWIENQSKATRLNLLIFIQVTPCLIYIFFLILGTNGFKS